MGVEREIVALAPCFQVPDLLSVGDLIIVGDETQDGCVVRELKGVMYSIPFPWLMNGHHM